MSKLNLIILHGWEHDSSYWEEFVRLIRDRNIAVIPIDLPGFGKEKLARDNWGIPEYANWVKKKIQKKKLKNVVLLGHSFGGRIASLIASKNPVWLKGLILYGSPAIYRPSHLIRLKKIAAQTVKATGINVNFGKSLELKTADHKGLGKIFRKTVNFDQTSLISQVAVSTLLLWGEEDKEVPLRIAREMKILIPNSKLVIISKTGHNAHLENPYLFYGKVNKFIQSL